MTKLNKQKLIILLLFFSFFVSFYFEEDILGGAKHDFEFHEIFIINFAQNFKFTLFNYGYDELYARNFPTFYILTSIFYKIGLTIDQIRFLNIFFIILDNGSSILLFFDNSNIFCMSLRCVEFFPLALKSFFIIL